MEMTMVKKITMAKAARIREKYATGNYSMARLAKQHRLSEGVISRIVNNKVCPDPDYVRPAKTSELVATALENGATVKQIAEHKKITPEAVRYHLPPDCIFRVERRPSVDGRLSQMLTVVERERAADPSRTLDDIIAGVALRYWQGDRFDRDGRPLTINSAGVAQLAKQIREAIGTTSEPLTRLDQMNRMVEREVQKGVPVAIATERVASQFAGKQGIRATTEDSSRYEVDLLAQRLKQLQLENDPC